LEGEEIGEKHQAEKKNKKWSEVVGAAGLLGGWGTPEENLGTNLVGAKKLSTWTKEKFVFGELGGTEGPSGSTGGQKSRKSRTKQKKTELAVRKPLQQGGGSKAPNIRTHSKMGSQRFGLNSKGHDKGWVWKKKHGGKNEQLTRPVEKKSHGQNEDSVGRENGDSGKTRRDEIQEMRGPPGRVGC